MTNAEAKAISYRKAINEKAETLRALEAEPLMFPIVQAMRVRGLKQQIREYEIALSALPVE